MEIPAAIIGEQEPLGIPLIKCELGLPRWVGIFEMFQKATYLQIQGLMLETFPLNNAQHRYLLNESISPGNRLNTQVAFASFVQRSADYSFSKDLFRFLTRQKVGK